MTKTVPARLIGLRLPARVDQSENELARHLAEAIRKRHPALSADTAPAPQDEEIELDFGTMVTRQRIGGEGLSEKDMARTERWAAFLHNAREQQMLPLRHLKNDERKLVVAAAHGAHFRSVLTRDEMEEKIAALHAQFPWLAKASTQVMNHMRSRTMSGASPFHTPPLILLGAPGIAKSSWARALASIFAVPSIDIDVGATNGAVLAIAGVEKGWGNACIGRVVHSFLHNHVANPVVILDELDKIATQVSTDKGGSLPGAFDVLKSMIEPCTAAEWRCPYQLVPYDLRHVSWIMTTDSLNGMSAAFLDRCKVVELPAPTQEQMIRRGAEMLAGQFEDEDILAAAQDFLGREIRATMRRHSHTSLRTLERMVSLIVEGFTRPLLH